MKLIVRLCNTEQLWDVFLVEHKYMAQTENLICNYSLGYVSNNLDMLIIILFITNYTLCELESFRFITSVHKQFLLTVPEDNLPLFACLFVDTFPPSLTTSLWLRHLDYWMWLSRVSHCYCYYSFNVVVSLIVLI